MVIREELKSFHTYTLRHVVTSCEVTPQNQMRPSYFLRMMQEAADLDSAELGVSRKELEAANQLVMVSRNSIQIYRYPQAHEEIQLVTLHRSIRGVRMYRDFLFFSGDYVLAEATNEYCMVSASNRHAVRPDLYANNPNFAQQNYKPGNPQPKRIVLPTHLLNMGNRKVYYSHLDQNGHLNNANYCDFAIDALPAVLRPMTPDFFEMNFHREAAYQSTIQMQYGYDGEFMYIGGMQEQQFCFAMRMHFSNLPQFEYEKKIRMEGGETVQ